MAEFVQKSVEDMLPELEQLKRVKLFNDNEIKKVIKKRRAFEYRLCRRTKLKEDYLSYVQYEIALLALIRKRRMRIGYHFKKEEIEYPIINRIHSLFRFCQERFKYDVKVWLSHIEFCKKVSQRTYVGQMFSRMLQMHSSDPRLWILAAKWEFEEQKSVETARQLLQRALRFHSESEKLWLEYYRMELMESDRMRKRLQMLGAEKPEESEETDDAVLQGKVALVVFKQAMETVDDVNFCVGFLKICRLFDFARKEHETAIVTYLEEHYQDKEEGWDAIIRCHFESKIISSSIEDAVETSDTDKVTHKLEADYFKLYEDAVSRLGTPKMWSLYIKAIEERLELKDSEWLSEKRLLCLFELLERASEADALTEVLYLRWLELLGNCGFVEKLETVMRMSTEKFPQSAELWKQRLAFHIHCNDEAAQIRKLFQEAHQKVPEKDSLPLWSLQLEWTLCAGAGRDSTDDSQSAAENLLVSACNSGAPEVAVPMKEYWLQWTAQQFENNIQKVRAVYKRLCNQRPLSCDFFQKYIAIENSLPKPSIKRLRKTYEAAVAEFGETNTDIWIDYIKMEMNHPNGNPLGCGKLHWRAKKQLRSDLVDEFISHYVLLQTVSSDPS